MPRVAKLAAYYDVPPHEVVWWMAVQVMQRHRAPSVHEFIDRFGMSLATANRWRRIARDKLDQINAREGQHGHANH